eukprot:SAG22_NODE_196_length_15552_cov_971.604543_7_plen_57_part_00
MSVILLMYVLARQSYAEPPGAEDKFIMRTIEIFVTSLRVSSGRVEQPRPTRNSPQI